MARPDRAPGAVARCRRMGRQAEQVAAAAALKTALRYPARHVATAQHCGGDTAPKRKTGAQSARFAI
ncbi:hypothetical protein XHV734_2858 [Xanthomonas hortorum pv. vitians]|nr:hypothetical protein XHV734_2858 [Xanthomonas hortorum pv. vitians]